LHCTVSVLLIRAWVASAIYPLSLHDALPICLFAVNITVQELLLAVVGARAQGVTLEVEPAGPPLIVKLTVPTGGLFVPLAVSCTVGMELGGTPAAWAGRKSSVV